MAKYRDHQELGANAPLNWREKTRAEDYQKGLSGITPPGMKVKEQRVGRFKESVNKTTSAKWHRNYDVAMFGGTEVPLPNSESKQLALEEMLNGIERIPQAKRR